MTREGNWEKEPGERGMWAGRGLGEGQDRERDRDDGIARCGSELGLTGQGHRDLEVQRRETRA